MVFEANDRQLWARVSQMIALFVRSQWRDAVYRFLTDLAGDRPGYEEALRALYRGETEPFRVLIAGWPQDVRAYAGELLAAGCPAA